MAVRVLWLGASKLTTIAEVCDGGRTIVVDGDRYVLNRLTTHYVLEGRPYWDRRVTLLADE